MSDNDEGNESDADSDQRRRKVFTIDDESDEFNADDSDENLLDDTKIYVDAAMIKIQHGLKSEKICRDLRGEKKDTTFLTKDFIDYLDILKSQVPIRLLRDDRDFLGIDEIVDPLLRSSDARNGLQNMMDSVVCAIDALCYCGVDLFSAPKLKVGNGCCLIKCLQKLSCKRNYCCLCCLLLPICK